MGHVHPGRDQGSASSVFINHSQPCFLRQSLSLNLEFTVPASLVLRLDMNVYHLFTWVLGALRAPPSSASIVGKDTDGYYLTQFTKGFWSIEDIESFPVILYLFRQSHDFLVLF